MKSSTTSSMPVQCTPVGKALEEGSASFDRFCLAAGLEVLSEMMERDAEEAGGPRQGSGGQRRGLRWGGTRGKIGFHGGKVDIERPRVRELNGKEFSLPSWDRAIEAD